MSKFKKMWNETVEDRTEEHMNICEERLRIAYKSYVCDLQSGILKVKTQVKELERELILGDIESEMKEAIIALRNKRKELKAIEDAMADTKAEIVDMFEEKEDGDE